jgi:Spy/CpxP family protein refolding chaperone
MRVIASCLLFTGMILLTSNGLYSQDKKDDPKVKVALPSGWGKLDLTADQKASIHKVQIKYKEDIDKLKDKIKDMQNEEKQEMVKLLTPEQKKKLQELATGDSAPPKK